MSSYPLHDLLAPQGGAACTAPKRRAVALLLTLALGQFAQAADGGLDPSFDGDGRVIFAVPRPVPDFGLDEQQDQLFGVAILPDGRIAVGGTTTESRFSDFDFVVGAFSPNGSLDTGFGNIETPGLRITNISDLRSGGGLNAPPPSGICTGITSDPPLVPARPEDVANALVLQNDQGESKIVLVGRSGPNDSPRFAAVRYTGNGQPDTGFGVDVDGDGIVETPFPDNLESNACDGAVQTDGKIILAGVVGDNVLSLVLRPDGGCCARRTGDIALVRYNRDGSLDDGGPSDSNPADRFGSDGMVRTTHFGASNFAFALAVAVQLDGKIVAGGEVDPEFVPGVPESLRQGDFVLVRYNQDGSLDDDRLDDNGLDDADLPDMTPGDRFGDNGTVTTDFGLSTDLGLLSDDTVMDLVLQPDGKIVAGGTARPEGARLFALARYNVNGTLDPSFGTGGTKTTDFPGALGGGMAALVRQPGGKLVAAGSTTTGGDRGPSDFALVRYQPNGREDTTFGDDVFPDINVPEPVPDGITITNFEPGRTAAEGQDVVLDAEGKIVVAGFFRSIPSGARFNDFALARYQSSVIPENLTCQGHPPTVIGTPGNDILVGTPGDDVIHGLEGIDTIIAQSGDDIVCGGPGDDLVFGGPGGDAIEGGDGSDRLVGDQPFAGVEGPDTLRGGEGDDELFGFGGNDLLEGEGGNDKLVGGLGDDMLNGGPGVDGIFGEGGADKLAGDAGNDTLVGDTLPSDAAAGPDVLRGGEGDDKLFGADRDDQLLGDAGRDELDGGPGNDVLDGGLGDDPKLFGGDDNDTIRGGPGRFKDRLVGEAGRDVLRGGPGDDRLIGGTGRDRLFGEAGNDTMDGQGGSDSGLGGPGRSDRCFSMGPRRACENLDLPGPRPKLPPRPVGPGALPVPTPCNFPQCGN